MALNVKPLYGVHYPFNHPSGEKLPEEGAVCAHQEENSSFGDHENRQQKLIQRVKKLNPKKLKKLLDSL